MTPRTIDEVVAQLDQIILDAGNERSRLGFFAALYRNVTVKVKEGIAAGVFQDGPRMEKLDVTFASRYLAALASFRRGEPCSKCWLVAFQLSTRWPPIILQHPYGHERAHQLRSWHRCSGCRARGGARFTGTRFPHVIDVLSQV